MEMISVVDNIRLRKLFISCAPFLAGVDGLHLFCASCDLLAWLSRAFVETIKRLLVMCALSPAAFW